MKKISNTLFFGILIFSASVHSANNFNVDEIKSFDINPYSAVVDNYDNLESSLSEDKFEQFMRSNEVVETLALRDLFGYCQESSVAFYVIKGYANKRLSRGESKEDILKDYAEQNNVEFPFSEDAEPGEKTSQFALNLGWENKDKNLSEAELDKYYFKQCMSLSIEDLKQEYL